MHPSTAVVLSCLLGLGSAAVHAQGLPYLRAVVIADTGTVPATLAVEVDLATGAWLPLAGLPSDTHAPLALERDPIDGTFLVALDTGSATQVMRRHWQPTLGETVVGTVPGRAVELLVDRFGDVIVVIGGSNGGLHRLPRHGGAPTLVRQVANVTAAGAPQNLHWNAILGISGTIAPPLDPGIADVDLDSGNWTWGPFAFVNFTPRGITGLIDMPTGVPRQILAHDDGTMSVASWALGGNPQPLATQPVLPGGGIVAMKAHEYFVGLVLGGAANPNLYTFDPLTALGGSIGLTQIAGPLLGTPVDYAVVPPVQPGVITFGRPCGVAAELRIGQTPGAGPQIGNANFGVTLRQALPLLPAWLVLGFAETAIAMPTGCELHVNPFVVGAQWADAGGDATLPVPIPNDPALLGVRFFGQWLQADNGAPFMASDLALIRIG